MTKKSNQVIYCTPEEKAWLKEQLENYRLGITSDSTTSVVNSITMAKQEILEAIRSTSTTRLNSDTSYIRTALIIYFYEKRKRETPGWTKGSVDSWANWCIKQDPEIGSIVNQVLGVCPKEKPRKNPFSKIVS